jgi:circadian clock protein KaiC
MQFLVEGAAKGKKGLMISLDEHPQQICRNADRLGIELQKHVENGNIRIIFDSPLELDLDEHFSQIKRYVEENKIERVVVDSLAAYENAQPDEAREFICALSTYFKDNLVTAFFNYESPELVGVSQISEELKASAIVDNIILLNYVEISTKLRRVITVPKSRGSDPDHESQEYIIKKGGINLVDKYEGPKASPVPQLPLNAYYGVLATSPTRRSPLIDESIQTGKPLPESSEAVAPR